MYKTKSAEEDKLSRSESPTMGGGLNGKCVSATVACSSVSQQSRLRFGLCASSTKADGTRRVPATRSRGHVRIVRELHGTAARKCRRKLELD